MKYQLVNGLKAFLHKILMDLNTEDNKHVEVIVDAEKLFLFL
jgi:hypothetical protein